jgi:hypothetical protein
MVSNAGEVERRQGDDASVNTATALMQSRAHQALDKVLKVELQLIAIATERHVRVAEDLRSVGHWQNTVKCKQSAQGT